MTRPLDIDTADYIRFSGPGRAEKELRTLEGLLYGITADNELSSAELRKLDAWLSTTAELVGRHPYNEVVPALRHALVDGVITDEERDDILWLCSKMKPGQRVWDAVTADIQRLHGILGGMLADGVVSATEVRYLRSWLDGHGHLRQCWPYDEVDALVTEVLRDGRIDANEQALLKAYFTEFSGHAPMESADAGDVFADLQIGAVCTSCPEVTFRGRRFCFTGSSQRSTRAELAALIAELGGEFSKSLRKDVHYLVVGADGNPCWAFACYGRKVEQAMRLRAEGSRLLIVHESDFWDAVAS